MDLKENSNINQSDCSTVGWLVLGDLNYTNDINNSPLQEQATGISNVRKYSLFIFWKLDGRYLEIYNIYN